jgi:hypothetical protein
MKIIDKKENRGGKRSLCGRKKTNVETKILSFRVPTAKARTLKETIKKIIKND